jgi:predicted phage-related endonuclease
MILQGTEEWFAARLGKVTASRVDEMMAKTKSGAISASRKNLAAELMLERVTGQREDGFVSAAMRFGIEQEPLARLAYSIHAGLDIEEIGFIEHPTIARSGASPDGLVGIDGMIEIKCGNTATHCRWAIAGVIPPEHILQLHWQLACSGRKWNDFVSFDPRMPEGQQLFIRRLLRDDEQISKLEQEVVKFDAEIEALVEACNKVTWY